MSLSGIKKRITFKRMDGLSKLSFDNMIGFMSSLGELNPKTMNNLNGMKNIIIPPFNPTKRIERLRN